MCKNTNKLCTKHRKAWLKLQNERNPVKVVQLARKMGLEVEEGTNHTLLVSERGITPVNRHKGKDLPTGTHKSILKAIRQLLGLGMVIGSLIGLVVLNSIY